MLSNIYIIITFNQHLLFNMYLKSYKSYFLQ